MAYTIEEQKYIKSAKTAIKRLEKAINDIAITNGVVGQAFSKWVEKRERFLDSPNYRYCPAEVKQELDIQLNELTKTASEFAKNWSNARSESCALKSIQLKKQAQIEWNIKRWQNL